MIATYDDIKSVKTHRSFRKIWKILGFIIPVSIIILSIYLFFGSLFPILMGGYSEKRQVTLFLISCLSLPVYLIILNPFIKWVIYYRGKIDRSKETEESSKLKKNNGLMSKILKSFAKGTFWLIVLRVLWEIFGYIPELVNNLMNFIL